MAATIVASRPRTARSGWVFYAVLALLFGLYLGINSVVGLRGTGIAAWKPLVWEISSVVVIFALIPLVVRFEAHYRLDGHPRWRIAIAHVGAALTFSALHVAGMLLLRKVAYAVVGQRYDFDSLTIQAFYELQKDLITYVVILVVIFANREFQVRRTGDLRAAELAAELDQARLKALTAQIEPHFLFNTLNAVAGLVREKRNAAAVDMIAGLSDFLRRVVEDSDRQQVPLAEELEFAQKYLDIQKVRFADRLQVSVDVPPELFPAQVPSLILQPMVENAVKHGIAKRIQGGAIRIAAFCSNGMLTLRVYNDGPSLPADWEATCSGIGISNARTRLQTLYGDRFELNLRNQSPGGVEVSVSVPFISSSVVSPPPGSPAVVSPGVTE
jgi:two-component system, LytTR family, sensor kinase